MSVSRIKAILLQEYYVTKRSLEVIMDLFFFSFVFVAAFGFVSVFLAEKVSSSAAQFLILGIILWEIIRVTQYSTSVGTLWNVWSHNLSNMFVAPLSLKDYMFAHILSGITKSLIVFVGVSLLANGMFGFNILDIGIENIILYFINLTIFAWSVGIILLGTIFRFGTRLQALAWGFVFIFQPLTAAYFPVEVLPPFLQTIAYTLPPTYVFAAARQSLTDPTINWQFFSTAFALNIVYLLFAIWFFNMMFKKSKDSGQFARLGE